MNKKEKQNREELFRLMRENPDLPIIPMVAEEICEEGYAYGMGELGWSSIDEYILANRYDDRILFKSDGDVLDVLERYLSEEEFDKLSEDETEWQEIYDGLPWTMAIVVYIKVPTE